MCLGKCFKMLCLQFAITDGLVKHGGGSGNKCLPHNKLMLHCLCEVDHAQPLDPTLPQQIKTHKDLFSFASNPQHTKQGLVNTSGNGRVSVSGVEQEFPMHLGLAW